MDEDKRINIGCAILFVVSNIVILGFTMSSDDWAAIGQIIMLGIAVAIVAIVWYLIKNNKILEEKSWVLVGLVILGLVILFSLLIFLLASHYIVNVVVGVLITIVLFIIMAWHFFKNSK